jgi:hypothetical protein
MKRQVAGFIFLEMCIALALLLITGVLTPVVDGAIFAGSPGGIAPFVPFMPSDS